MPAQRKYPEELRERAVRMVLEIRAVRGRPGWAGPGGPSAQYAARELDWTCG